MSARTLDPAAVHTRVAHANGIEIHYREQGRGTPLVLLHGFPDHAGAWAPLVAALGGSCRTVAPDLRGYGRTTRPLAPEAYAIETLADDVLRLLDALELETAVICGHDWGGVLGFWLALRHPERLAALVAINAPHPLVLQELIWDDSAQRAASQYIAFLRSPEAEATFHPGNVDALIERLLGEARTRGAIDDAGVDEYRRRWSEPGAWPAMLAWYRAAPFDVPPVGDRAPPLRWTEGRTRTVEPPVQLIWGERDEVFVRACAEASAAACRRAEIAWLAEAGHSPHRDEPARCAAIITQVLAEHGAR